MRHHLNPSIPAKIGPSTRNMRMAGPTPPCARHGSWPVTTEAANKSTNCAAERMAAVASKGNRIPPSLARPEAPAHA